MNTRRVFTSLVALVAATSSSAYALEGNYDGLYSVHYNHLEMTVACGDLSETLSTDLQDERLPEGALDALEAEAIAEIEAAGLSEKQEAAAVTATEQFFTTLHSLIDDMLLSFPDTFSVDALAGTQDLYAFKADMADEDIDLEDVDLVYSSIGYMDAGVFEGMPFDLSVPLEELDYIHQVIEAVALSADLSGQVADGSGLGELSWGFDVQSTGLATGSSLSCTVKTQAAFELAL